MPAMKPDSDKSELRLAREKLGLSRAQLAAAVGTTVHYVWCVEMPPYDAPPEIAERVAAFLASPTTPTTPQPASGRGAPRGQSVKNRWVCPRCGYTETPSIRVEAVAHSCKAAKKVVELRRIEDD